MLDSHIRTFLDIDTLFQYLTGSFFGILYEFRHNHCLSELLLYGIGSGSWPSRKVGLGDAYESWHFGLLSSMVLRRNGVI
jgi:hypothetical protein